MQGAKGGALTLVLETVPEAQHSQRCKRKGESRKRGLPTAPKRGALRTSRGQWGSAEGKDGKDYGYGADASLGSRACPRQQWRRGR